MPRKLQPNDRGFRWNRGTKVYHTTLALDAVLSEGLKSRRDLSERVHATGGGPDEAISFTTDIRVARAICVGLVTLAKIAKGQMLLGDLVISASSVAPEASRLTLADMKLREIDIVNRDRGLFPFSSSAWSAGEKVDVDLAVAEIAADPASFEDVKTDSMNDGAPYAVSGWSKVEALKKILRQPDQFNPRSTADIGFEFYKRHWLPYAFWDKAAYNPDFIGTSASKMAEVDESQIGILVATLDADWVCTESKAAEQMGYYDEAQSIRWDIGDWAHDCEHALRFGHKVRTIPRGTGWEQPDPKDTVYYIWNLSEPRVYDSGMIRGLKLEEEADDALSKCEQAWYKKGIELEAPPIAHPWFTEEAPYMR